MRNAKDERIMTTMRLRKSTLQTYAKLAKLEQRSRSAQIEHVLRTAAGLK